MPIIFRDEIKKVDPLKSEALKRLRAFLNENEPKLVYFLNNFWNDQANAITYKQLREWILDGDLSIELLEEWEQDYSKFVYKYMKPLYDAAIIAAADQVKRKYPDYHYDAKEFVDAYTDKYSARFVTNSSADQILAVRQLVRRAANLGDLTVDQLARAIRPAVGLTRQQASAYANYHGHLINSGLSPKNALDKALRYRARQHRQRGYTIARTELAFAYNDAEYRSILDAQQKGYMGHVVKQWSTAADERVCHICKGLDGMQIEIDETFPYKTRLPHYTKVVPPAHPRCRCAVIYIETAPPEYGPEFYVSGAAAE
jgi:SPP1 gp7 family putative phage head morphogenesis protein